MIFIRRYDPIYTISKKFTCYRLKVWKQRDTLKRKIRKFINNKIYQQRTKIDKNHFNFTSEQNFDIISSTSKLLNDSVVLFHSNTKKKKKEKAKYTRNILSSKEYFVSFVHEPESKVQPEVINN